MEGIVKVNELFTQVQRLEKEDQLSLLQKLVSLIQKKVLTQDNSVHLSSLSGLGSEVWQKIDIDDYIETERQW